MDIFNRFVKISLLIIAAIVAIFILVFVLFCLIISPPMPSKSSLEKELIKNVSTLTEVVQSLKDPNYKNILITDWNTNPLDKTIVIPSSINEATATQIRNLFKHLKYQAIAKENNYILFQKWSSIRADSGILYLYDGAGPNSNTGKFATLEKLSIEGWYYYIER